MVVATAAKTGFGFALGFSALQIIGILFVITGAVLASKGKEKEKRTAQFWIGIVLMVIGVALGFGFGGDQLFSALNI